MASPARTLHPPLHWLASFWRRKSLDPLRPFDLRTWFAIVGLVSITALSIFAAALLTRLLTDRMLRHEGVLTMEFVQAVILVENAEQVFSTQAHERTPEAFLRIAKMPDVLRANLYSAQRQLIWSSDPEIIGKKFDANPELDRALAGELTVNEEDEEEGEDLHKSEHTHLTHAIEYFVEIYIPVWDEKHSKVVGSVELYKNPRPLFEAIQAGKRMIWVGAMAGGVFLFLALFSMIQRADNLIRSQQKRLVESERLAAVGELGSAVAHGIRNPLTAIRSSAELALEGDPDLSREAARDIMAEVDRLEQWVRELLSYSRPVAGQLDAIDVVPILRRCAHEFGREMEKRGVNCQVDVPDNLPPIQGDAILLAQVVTSLIANSLEAMAGEDGGTADKVTLSAALAEGGKVMNIAIGDNGPGMTREQRERAFRPFYTTKAQGLGVGLPLAKRIIERFGGRISIDSQPGKGTTVLLRFPIVQ